MEGYRRLQTGRALIPGTGGSVIDASRQPSLAMAFLDALWAMAGPPPVMVIAGANDGARDEAKRLGAESVLDSPLHVSRLRSGADTLVARPARVRGRRDAQY